MLIEPEMIVALRPLLHAAAGDGPAKNHPVVDYLRTHYVPLPREAAFDSFALFARRGSALDPSKPDAGLPRDG